MYFYMNSILRHKARKLDFLAGAILTFEAKPSLNELFKRKLFLIALFLNFTTILNLYLDYF